MIRRREFITLLGGAAAAWPVVARAQQAATPVVGFLNLASPEWSTDRITAFRQGLLETGYDEGRNVAVEYRWANGDQNRLPILAADLVSRRVDVIAATSTGAARAAKSASSTIPIVFYVGGDPVQDGLVASINRPGGNLTGISNLGVELGPKQIELMHELVPNAAVIALLINPTNPTAEVQAKELENAARILGLHAPILRASNDRDLETVSAKLLEVRAGAVLFVNDLFFNSRGDQLAALAVRHSIPAISQFREFAVAGGLASYGSSATASYRQVGVYVGRILKGEKATELPVQRPTKFELTINLKAAKSLGLTISLPLLGRADEVIE